MLHTHSLSIVPHFDSSGVVCSVIHKGCKKKNKTDFMIKIGKNIKKLYGKSTLGKFFLKVLGPYVLLSSLT